MNTNHAKNIPLVLPLGTSCITTPSPEASFLSGNQDAMLQRSGLGGKSTILKYSGLGTVHYAQCRR